MAVSPKGKKGNPNKKVWGGGRSGGIGAIMLQEEVSTAGVIEKN